MFPLTVMIRFGKAIRQAQTSPLLFKIVLGVLTHYRKKEMKGIQVGTKEVKPPLFTDDVTLYVRNPKGFMKKGKKTC